MKVRASFLGTTHSFISFLFHSEFTVNHCNNGEPHLEWEQNICSTKLHLSWKLTQVSLIWQLLTTVGFSMCLLPSLLILFSFWFAVSFSQLWEGAAVFSVLLGLLLQHFSLRSSCSFLHLHPWIPQLTPWLQSSSYGEDHFP